MGDLKEDDNDNSSLWQGHGIHPSSHSIPQIQPPYDSNFLPLTNHHFHGRQHNPSLPFRPAFRDDGMSSGPALTSHQSFPSLKRAYDGGHDLGYMDNAHDVRDESSSMPRASINPDHRLLNFGALPPKHTLVDVGHRVKCLDLTAQIHGMFFLSELATAASEHSGPQPELTCYRRNLFSISGSVRVPRGPLFAITDRGDRGAIVSLEVTVSASESVDNHTVKLIVIPWKTPPPNTAETVIEGEQEPAPLPLVPSDNSGAEFSANGECTIYPIAFRRLQFRIATANNGRRRELQQHFLLHLNVIAKLADGTRMTVNENSTAPVIVRGRSPRNFQTRKEIPLIGSSSSRGIPPEVSFTAGMMQHPTIVQRSATFPKNEVLDLPRTSFTFDSSTLSGSPSISRQSTFPKWNNSQMTTSPHSQRIGTVPSSSTTYQGLASSLEESYLQASHFPGASSPHHIARPATLPGSRSTLPQYPFHTPDSIPSQDESPRPTKSPRNDTAPEPTGRYNMAHLISAREQTLPRPRASRGHGDEYYHTNMPISHVPSTTATLSFAPSWNVSGPMSTSINATNLYTNCPPSGLGDSSSRQHQPSQYHLLEGVRANTTQHIFSKQEADSSDGQQYTWNHQ